jgi:hypothetical protein
MRDVLPMVGREVMDPPFPGHDAREQVIRLDSTQRAARPLPTNGGSMFRRMKTTESLAMA